MSMGESAYDRVNDYGAVKVSLASPSDIRSRSFGEVKKPETINYRTYRPEKDGLFCEKIFGPEKDWECACGKFRGMKYKGMVCDRCGVKVTHSRVRRKRMGHIELAAPVVHIWFFKATPSRLGTLLDMKTSNLEKVIYFQDYVVVDPGDTDLKERQILSEDEFRNARSKYGEAFKADMGAEAVKQLLLRLDLAAISKQLRQELTETSSKQKLKDLTKRLKVVEALRDSENRPEWMVLECIPVIPPDLRPLVLLDSGNFATSDLNDLYRRIINRNNRLKKLVDLNAPEVIIRNEKRMLQQAVDALFDNNRCKRPVVGSSNRALKSLTDMIKGKQGRFRENLLGKRVDYSARSVIVVGPELRLHQCGLPKKIALELFQPFIIRRLKEQRIADTIKSAKKMLERRDPAVWDILEEVIKHHPVLLNRAPTLHRIGIQAFEPVLVEGNAIRIHPLVCRGFNADFDGDQMAVHLPLSIEAQVEAMTLMMSTNNIFSPANGSPIISPTQDIVMGSYYLTVHRPGDKGEGMVFASPQEVFLAFSLRKMDVHAKIKVRIDPTKKVKGEGEKTHKSGKLLETTVGRVIFNDILDRRMAYYNVSLSQKQLQSIIADCYQLLGRAATIDLLDRMKDLGFRESTRSGLSFATDDLRTPSTKDKILAEAEKYVSTLYRNYENGMITKVERYNMVVDAWTQARDKITNQMMEELKNDVRNGEVYLNPIYLMADSGARGGVGQITQLSGMRGLMAKPNGDIIETPIKANFREGLSVLEYFSSTHGARKGLADTALKTADSGYLTRKLADVAQNVVVTMFDCGTTQGITKGAVYKGEKLEVSLFQSVRGRVSRVNIQDPITNEVVVRENDLITIDRARKLEDMQIEKIQVRSPMTCEAPLGVCQCCYGMDLATGQLVEQGMAVGIIAAQSIGEPGTQLTMRTFHIGGVASRGLEEKEHKSKREAIVRYVNINAVTMEDGKRVALTRNGELQLFDDHGREVDKFDVPNGSVLFIEDGQKVPKGTVLCEWDPHNTPIISEVDGIVKFEDLNVGETLKVEIDASGNERRTVMEHKGNYHPQIIVTDDTGHHLVFYTITEKAELVVDNGQRIKIGETLAKTPREMVGTQDITAGLPRLTELFEARRPKVPAVMAEIDGQVELLDQKRRGKWTIKVKNPSGIEREHLVPHGKHLRVHTGDYVRAGDPLVVGPLVPHDILRITGEEAVQRYLLREVQNVYRAQSVTIDDKHLEIIVAQMLRKVKVETVGDTGLLPGSVIDKFELRRVNTELANCVKIKDPGDTGFESEIVPRDLLEEVNQRIELEGGRKAEWVKPKPASGSTQLLGITKAAVQSESFISAASFQETTKVLTEAALAGKVDRLVGLKENVILGHLVPAGTGFKIHQEARVGINIAEPQSSDESTVA
ncbi:DNA-directed RNA polymerase subunit beta' [bacterium]|nr:DNA-directed RNA polymerase subunit beta' [bacterium]